jgi:general nucleoside transport system ATP-binding protein
VQAVEMRGISKRFPGIVANDHIDLTVRQGDIHALLGENGAGKSTLMNILFGLSQPDEGEIRIKGKPVTIASPMVANRLGIGMVHQHFMLVPPFTVTENIILGEERSKRGWIDLKRATREIGQLSERYRLKVDPDAKIADISVGMQQRVEILKTLYRDADILLFDEPTAVLTPPEIEELIEIMRNLAQEGKTILFITHKLKEIMRVCDRCTVIRRGKVITTTDVSHTDEQQLAAQMMGRQLSFRVDKIEAKTFAPVLQVKDLVVEDARGVATVRGLHLEVKAGEIVGLAGVDGNGQSELVEAITGLRAVKAGSIQLKNLDITHFKPRKVTQAGVGHIPEDRHKRGLVMDFTISENMVLQTYYQPPFSKGMRIRYDEMDRYAKRLMQAFDIRAFSEHTLVRTLSGGNQQKVIIAREVERNPDFLIAAQPTRGLDVGAIQFIHHRLLEQREKRKGILLISFELDELLTLSDRIAVIYEGQIVGWVDPRQVTEEELGLMMAGSTKNRTAK